MSDAVHLGAVSSAAGFRQSRPRTSAATNDSFHRSPAPELTSPTATFDAPAIRRLTGRRPHERSVGRSEVQRTGAATRAIASAGDGECEITRQAARGQSDARRFYFELSSPLTKRLDFVSMKAGLLSSPCVRSLTRSLLMAG